MVVAEETDWKALYLQIVEDFDATQTALTQSEEENEVMRATIRELRAQLAQTAQMN